jgi:hypothetical protein
MNKNSYIYEELGRVRSFSLDGCVLTKSLVRGQAESHRCQKPPKACQGGSQDIGQVAKSRDESLK